MIAYQMTANVQKRMNALRDKPERLPGRAALLECPHWRLADTQGFRQGRETAKISGWASVKIDSTNYPEVIRPSGKRKTAMPRFFFGDNHAPGQLDRVTNGAAFPGVLPDAG